MTFAGEDETRDLLPEIDIGSTKCAAVFNKNIGDYGSLGVAHNALDSC